MSTYDYIIIGAGSAGCLLANRLSADKDVNVLLLEAGGKDDYFWIPIPVGYLYTINNPRTDWCYISSPDDGLNGRQLNYARGKGLGGSSSINAMIYMRGQREDYDHWAALGNTGWSWDEVLPYFLRTENYIHGADDFHGDAGELRVEERRVHWAVLDDWRAAAAQCGIPPVNDFNRGNNNGCGYFQVNQQRGRRWSAADAFLKPISSRPNLTLMLNATVHGINLQHQHGNKRAVSVDVSSPNEGKIRFTAQREILLCAGAIGSPQILEMSGIGNGNHLQSLGINPVHDLPGVGNNLQDHLQIRMVYKLRNAVTLNRRANNWPGKCLMALEYLMFKTGPLTMAPSQLGAFACSSITHSRPNIQWHVQPLSLDKFGDPLHSFDAITPSVCNLRPTSRGSVHIQSPSIDRQPEIRLNYLSTSADRQVAIEAMLFNRRIMAAPALAKYDPQEWRPGPEVSETDDMVRAAGDLGTTIFHPVGTCKMGNDPLAVVDERLRLHGIQGLRIADASVMPTITSGNTNAPTTMIAEKAAEIIVRDSRA